MTELLTAAQMRAIETAAIESGSVTGLELMERAGQGVVDAVFSEWPDLAEGSFRAVILCGPGNNGGDGFVVARLLRDAGWDVDVFLYGDAEKLPPDAKRNYERWCEVGEVAALINGVEPSTRGVNVIVDALFGTGLGRPFDDKDLRQTLMDVIDCYDAGHGIPVLERPAFCPIVVSVDLPSGICSDSGKVLIPNDPVGRLESIRIVAELTVTFHKMKVGHFLNEGAQAAGKITLVDIGLPKNRKSRVKSIDVAWDKFFLRKRGGHKFSHGHALILSGGPAQTGAARLAARGASRIGAGVVTLGVPPSAQMEVASHVTAVMVRRIGDAGVLVRVLEDQRINALCIGPALGLTDDKSELIDTVLESGRAVVLDADALTLIASDQSLFGKLHDKCVLTPHAGEFARLFPDISEKLTAPATTGPAYSKVDATRDAAKRAGCTVLFKGPDTVIASPDGRCSINSSAYERAAPWLATAGSGDVLAGFITGLMARGFAPHQAAESGAYLHTECALSFGAGLIAEDLPEELPKVFRALGL
ncbi:NAD(P)H-hydrate dehydratase [Octadecabacter sp. CECT 8868]|uniref:NAD(P)H-hydrate dehydratase n=1 Tax=Octadecabacter algicola TaxID=2909342 RepID=UPI001F3811B9|nr:NAD(P)H-hydrate dehydratase [Octadecabacter algicola]MCF2903516.1 NAD(P)H-hydrate dehydratase [Octadecabacter algicola]